MKSLSVTKSVRFTFATLLRVYEPCLVIRRLRRIWSSNLRSTIPMIKKPHGYITICIREGGGGQPCVIEVRGVRALEAASAILGTAN
jgi:hypothetical protein